MDLAALKDLYNRCDPYEALSPGDPRYVDLDEARDIRWVDILERRLGLAKTPRQLLVTGGRGAGKTTELLRLAERLAKPESVNLLPVYVPVEKHAAGSLGVGPVNLLIAMLRAALNAVGETAGKPLTSPVHPRNILDALLQDSASRDLASRMKDLYLQDARVVVAAANEVFARCLGAALKRGRTGLLLIVDSLDKVPFVGDLDAFLREFNAIPVSAIYTVPLWMASRAETLVLPMVRVVTQHGAPDLDGIVAMARALDGRMYPRDVLGEQDAWDRAILLAQRSGGCFQELLLLVRGLIEHGDVPAREADFEHVIALRASALSASSHGEVGAWLRPVAREKTLSPTEPRDAVKAALRSAALVYPYSDRGALWFDVHLSLREVLSREAEAGLQSLHNGTRTEPIERHAVSAVRLTNIGPFHELSLAIRPGWTVLLGDNGCGKTSVIRAIALVLAGTDPRAAVASQRQLRAGEATGTITVVTDEGEYSTMLSRARADVRTTATVDTLTQQGRWLTLAFPAMRGLSAKAISGPTSVTPPVPGAHDLMPLLEGAADARLDDTRQWIVNTALRAEGNEGEEIKRRHTQLLSRWFDLLRELMPGLLFEYERVDRESWQVLVKTADGIIPIEQLSQGMVSTIGWIGTLLRRLYEAFSNSARPEHEPALVLVDEIDAHLHPGWQQRIVPLVRKHFPNVQVIATSHSPLIVSNLEPDEVLVFSRGDEGQISHARVEEPLRGYRADQVLTSRAFGLHTSRSEYATTLLRDYAVALAATSDTPESRAALLALTERVRREIPSPPETIEERRALDASMREVDDAVRARLDAASPDEVDALETLLKSRRGGGEVA